MDGKNVADTHSSYKDIDRMAAEIPMGSEGISLIPFGNGAERILNNRDPRSSFHGINFHIHDRKHLLRAAQEGVAFSFRYGMDIMKNMGMDVRLIRAGNANMFLSPVFREVLATVSGASIEIYDTDGSVGAARGAGLGAGIYSTPAEAFATLSKLASIEPSTSGHPACEDAYQRWLSLI